MTDKRPTFLEVATKVAKGDPPKWLPIALEHFSDRMTEGPGDVNWAFKRLAQAVDDLLWLLPALEQPGFGLAGERKDVRVVLALLPSIKRNIEQGLRKGTGRPPDIGKRICAAVMLEAWQLARGDIEPHSGEFREACGQYWRASGGKVFWKPGNEQKAWRDQIDNALEMDREVFRTFMTTIVQNTP